MNEECGSSSTAIPIVSPTVIEQPGNVVAEEPHRSPIRFIVAFVLAFFFWLLAVVLINVAGNAAQIFPSPWRPAQFERPWKTRRFDEQVHRGNVPGLLIMGSSRVMQIRPQYVAAITGLATFNYGVSVAGPLDFLTQLRHAIQINAVPHRLVVGVDEQSLNDLPHALPGGRSNGGYNPRQAWTYQLQNLANWGLFRNLPWRDQLSIANWAIHAITAETTENSIASLANGPARLDQNSDAILLADGYLIYSERTLERAAGRFDSFEKVHQFIHVFHRNTPAAAWDVTPRKVNVLKEFLLLAHQHQITVDLMMLPIHPLVEEPNVVSKHMVEQRDLLRTTLARLCKETGAQWHDFSHISVYGGDPIEFWDGIHQTPENLRRMTNAIFGLPPDRVVIRLPGDEELLQHLPAVNTRTTR